MLLAAVGGGHAGITGPAQARKGTAVWGGNCAGAAGALCRPGGAWPLRALRPWHGRCGRCCRPPRATPCCQLRFLGACPHALRAPHGPDVGTVCGDVPQVMSRKPHPPPPPPPPPPPNHARHVPQQCSDSGSRAAPTHSRAPPHTHSTCCCSCCLWTKCCGRVPTCGGSEGPVEATGVSRAGQHAAAVRALWRRRGRQGGLTCGGSGGPGSSVRAPWRRRGSAGQGRAGRRHGGARVVAYRCHGTETMEDSSGSPHRPHPYAVCPCAY